MTRRLVLAMTIVAGLVAIALAIPLAISAGSDVRDDLIARLEVQTLSAASLLSSEPPQRWAETVEAAAAGSGARVVVVGADRRLVADSDATDVDRAFDRPEIDEALAGRLFSDVRTSTTLGTDLRFVAAPVVKGEQVVAAVRFTLPEEEVRTEVQRTVLWLVVFVVAVMVAAGLIAWLIARSIARPLESLAQVATDLAADPSLRADEQAGPIEVRSLAHAMNRTADRLIGLLRRQQRVAADASHHLRTPLTGVRMRLEAIEDTTDQDAVREQAVAATAEVDRLTRRIEQVLELARTDAGSMRTEVVDVSALARDRIEAASPLALDRDLTIETAITDGALVRSTPGTIARVIDELLGNAMAYARQRVQVSVAVSAAASDGDEVILQVEDDGPGVPDEEREAIFERFGRGSQAIAGGSGLGLALVRESARASDGDADASRGALGGLCVTVRWPKAHA